MIVEAPSPNHGPRRGGARPDMVILHYTAMETAEAALDRLRDPVAQVSAHYLIAEDGRIWRLVPEAGRAWHAGQGAWGAVGDVNSRSIGIELANPGPLAGLPPYPEPQMRALEDLLDGIRARWAIPPARVLGHSDTAPGRKSDPGPKFDWQRLARGGRAVWPGAAAPEPAEWGAFEATAGQAGYRATETGWRDVLDALRLRFRPTARGPLAGADMAVARALAVAHPCIDAGGDGA